MVERCNEVGESWIPCAGGSDGTRCESYEPMPDVDELVKLADEMDRSAHESEAYFAGVHPVDILEYARRIRKAIGIKDEEPDLGDNFCGGCEIHCDLWSGVNCPYERRE